MSDYLVWGGIIAAVLVLAFWPLLGTSLRRLRGGGEGLEWKSDTSRSNVIWFRWLFTIAWLAGWVPGLIQVMTTERRGNTVAESAGQTGLAALSNYGLVILLGVVSVAAWTQLRGQRTATLGLPFVLMLLPWVVVEVASFSASGMPPVNSFVYPVFLIALVACRPRIGDLSVLAYLLGFLSALVLAMGVFTPGAGLLHGISGALTSADKAIIGDTLLAGMFNHSNTLGVIISLGLPAVLLVKKRSHALLISAVAVAALMWTASRASIVAIAVALVAVLILGVIRGGRGRAFLGAVILIAAAIAVAAIPLTTNDPDAYSQRGQIWQGSLEAWGGTFLGGGYSWYGYIGQFVNDLLAIAFNGHNLFVHVAATGGWLMIIVVAAYVAAAVWASCRFLERGSYFAFAYTLTFLVNSSLEVVNRYRDLDPVFWIGMATLPAVVLAAANLAKRSPDAPLTGASQISRTTTYR